MSVFSIVIVFANFLFPHGDLHLRIEEVTQSIVQYPDSVRLYALRADLYLLHEDFDSARKDYQYCLDHALSTSFVLEGFSKVLTHDGKVDSALSVINLAIEKDSTSISALEWKARILYLLRNYVDAAGLYEQIIHKVDNPSPSLFMDASNAWSECKHDKGDLHAIEILEEGIMRIGPLHIFYQEMVRKLKQQLKYEKAIACQTILIEKSVNKVLPLAERSAIYDMAGQKEAAIRDIQQAILLMDEMPGYKSTVPAMKDLRSTLEYRLSQLQN
jgi:tetratricopeptide (TPR) repeat protein